MRLISKEGNTEIFRFDRGEVYPQVFTNFLKRKKIRGGFFWGLGGVVDPEIAFYDLSKKRYINKKIKGVFEILSLVGNVAISGKELVLHEHVVLGDKNYKTWGGHLNRAKIGGTLEIYFLKLNPLKRLKDDKTGLNLLN